MYWHNAIKSKITTLGEIGILSLVHFDPTMNEVGLQWVYKIKQWADDGIDRYKAYLVVNGFTQQEGIDYSKTFSLVVKLITIRLVLIVIISKGWQIQQFDIHNAFLNGSLREVVYMEQPMSFVVPNLPTHIYHLHKSLYNLKQAPPPCLVHIIERLFSFYLFSVF